jgi:D-xylulose 5-phosphate/D-fructose 6-phosphate phosphoketolase
MEGYVLTGRHGLFATYEAFAMKVKITLESKICAGHPDEKITGGLDGSRDRLQQNLF